MRKHGLLLVFTLVLAVAALPSAASAHQITTTGPPFNIFSGHPTQFLAGSPFHFLLGWDPLSLPRDAIGHYSVTLDVDGVQRAPSEHFFGPSPISDGAQARIWIWNFPSGLRAGTHTFVAHFLAPCYATGGPCATPNEVVEVSTRSMTVLFT
jgi:hypothetical protein